MHEILRRFAPQDDRERNSGGTAVYDRPETKVSGRFFDGGSTLFNLSLRYQINDFLNYFSSFRRRMAPVVYTIYLVARIAFPLYLILYGILQRFAPAYRNVYGFFLWMLAIPAVVPLLVDFGLAFLMHRRSGNRFHDGTVSFEENGISFSTGEDTERYAYAEISEVLHSDANLSYYLFLEHEDGELGRQRFSFIFPERCFTQGEPAAFGPFMADKTGLQVKEIK